MWRVKCCLMVASSALLKSIACFGDITISAMSCPSVVFGRTYANWRMTESSETVTWVAFENVGFELVGISILMFR